ncbi:MAG: redoxin domain-containing protein [Planctomycetota bacterium]
MIRPSYVVGALLGVIAWGCQPSGEPENRETMTVASTINALPEGDETKTEAGSREENRGDEENREDVVADEVVTGQGPAATEAVPPPTDSAEPTASLTLGDPAPPLQLSGWSKGEPLSSFEPGKVTVVEFWATWCGPCKMTMPHLSGLQAKYADDVRFVGISDEDAGIVNNFLKSPHPVEAGQTWSDVIGYSLAIDDQGATNRAYLDAAGQDGIPTAFIVGKSGEVEWIGHPMTIDEPLRQILDGTYDVQAAREEMERTQQLERQMQTLGRAFQEAVARDDKPAALEVLDQMDEVMPENPSIGIDRFELLFQMDRVDDAYQAMDTVIEQLWDHPDFLEYLTVRIADDLPAPQRRLEVAQRLAERAAELTNRSAGTLDALARVRYRQGDLAEAIELQREAVEASGQSAGDYQDRLDQYLEEMKSADSPDGTPDKSEAND